MINSTVDPPYLVNGTLPAYIIHGYDFTNPFIDARTITAQGFINNNNSTFVLLEYYAEQDYFDKYLADAQMIIDSVQTLS